MADINVKKMNRAKLLKFLQQRELDMQKLIDENEGLRRQLDEQPLSARPRFNPQYEQEAITYANQILRDAELRCSQREAQERQYIENLWIELRARMLQFCQTHTGLEQLISMISSIAPQWQSGDWQQYAAPQQDYGYSQQGYAPQEQPPQTYQQSNGYPQQSQQPYYYDQAAPQQYYAPPPNDPNQGYYAPNVQPQQYQQNSRYINGQT